jgi:hypothetical protein
MEGLNMKKTTIMAFSLILAALFSTSTISPAQAHIDEWTWLPPYVIRGLDNMFYQTNVVGYEAGSTATLIIPVTNDLAPPPILMNVSAVKIGFDWNINYSSDEAGAIAPVQLEPGETHVFKISFTVPNTTIASNMWAHTYKIYVEWVDATGAIIGSWTRNWDEKPGTPDYKFAVYSADQSDAVDLYYEYQVLHSNYPPSSFENINAMLLATQAGVEASMGGILYSRGNFAEAKTKIESALDLYYQALEAEGQWGTTYQGAELNASLNEAEAILLGAQAAMKEANASQTQADAAMKEAEAAVITANAIINQSYAWMLFGAAAVLFGVAAVIYAIKKPKM